MFNVPWIEYVGYAASILIGLSMFMKNIIKLRFINLIGSILFVFYGFTIKAYPVAIVNLIIVFVNIYYIYKLMQEK
ncbi:YgjV family protein [Clostridium sp. SM-530-WT-3G]|uniref:YgjV family protein n=1 Tax=Clostridium sp. SM-530-WT-3G TaxID=2725303 RepID=UPI00145E31B4|nr:YgjV family protein [Clostridium sp. SM-530-WT-3G]NME81667.1 YgjV family protein [Clostridium sp. SM-530-WT-3G]